MSPSYLLAKADKLPGNVHSCRLGVGLAHTILLQGIILQHLVSPSQTRHVQSIGESMQRKQLAAGDKHPQAIKVPKA